MNTGFIFTDSESLSSLNGANSVDWKESPILRNEIGLKNTNSSKNLTLKAFFSSKLDNFIQTNAQEIIGTVKRFYPATGQDIISRNGRSLNVKTNYQCITRMKEYETKSLEELRLEDYQANRRFKSRLKNEEITVESKIKQISDSIKNKSFSDTNNSNNNTFHKKSKPNALIRKSKNEMINYFNSLQNEINHRTDLSINRLNNYRHRMIKDLEIQKRLVIEDEDLESDELDESKCDLNETIVRQHSDNEAKDKNANIDNINNGLTIRNECIDSLLITSKPFKLVLSPTPTKSSIIDSTTSLSNFTATSTGTGYSLLSQAETRYLNYFTDRSMFSIGFFIMFFTYMFIWFVLCNKLKVVI